MTDSTRRVLGGRYELLLLLATGGMGQVWRGRDVLLDRPVAVKVLRSEYSDDPTFLSRFRAEAHHSAGLVHRNIATLFDYGESTDGAGERIAYLVMELVEGEPLSTVLDRGQRLSAARTLDILHQTASALAVAHAAGVVHRDVKPGNVLIGDDGVVRITDFGIAWSASSVPLTLTGQVVGTPHYLPPEQAAGEKACPAGDVYALGLIGYECLTGRRAFDGDNAVAIALKQLRDEPDPLPDDVRDDVRTLIGRALLKDPEERFPDGAAFRAAIEDVQAGRPLPALPTGMGTRTFGLEALFAGPDEPRPPRRRRVLVPLAALLTGAGIALAGTQLVGTPPGPPAVEAGVSTDDPTAAGVVVAPGSYVGRQVEQVAAELRALGLRVDLVPQPSLVAPGGEVISVSPVGTLERGDLVTVTYATAPERSEPPAAPETAGPAPVDAALPAAVDPGPGSGGAPQARPGNDNGKDKNDKDKKDKKGRDKKDRDKKDNGNRGNGRG